MTDESAVPRPFIIAAYTLVFLAVGALIAVAPRWDYRVGLFVCFVALLAWASENFAPDVGRYSISLAMPLAVTAMLLGGPVAAAIVSGLSSVNRQAFVSPRRRIISMYNLGQLVFVSAAAGATYLLLGGRLLSESYFRFEDFPGILTPLVLTAVVIAVGNVLLTSVGVALLYGEPVRAVLVTALPHIPSFLALIAVGYLMAQVVSMNPFSLVFFVFPLAVARDLYQRFKSLKDAYSDTIRSLVHALEAKDPYTRGHSERVSEYAVKIGRSMALDAKSCERLEYAGLLHDLGKIALSSELLTKPGALTDDEMSLMKNHPATGASLVLRIPPLSDLASLVVQHHERYEGGGYPYGVTFEETDLLSRILSVADAYDAMTTNRAYRVAMPLERARAILLQECGKQFDPAVVRAFSSTWTDQTEDPHLGELVLGHIGAAAAGKSQGGAE